MVNKLMKFAVYKRKLNNYKNTQTIGDFTKITIK
jgi:hypothetical protein